MITKLVFDIPKEINPDSLAYRHVFIVPNFNHHVKHIGYKYSVVFVLRTTIDLRETKDLFVLTQKDTFLPMENARSQKQPKLFDDYRTAYNFLYNKIFDVETPPTFIGTCSSSHDIETYPNIGIDEYGVLFGLKDVLVDPENIELRKA